MANEEFEKWERDYFQKTKMRAGAFEGWNEAMRRAQELGPCGIHPKACQELRFYSRGVGDPPGNGWVCSACKHEKTEVELAVATEKIASIIETKAAVEQAVAEERAKWMKATAYPSACPHRSDLILCDVCRHGWEERIKGIRGEWVRFKTRKSKRQVGNDTYTRTKGSTERSRINRKLARTNEPR